VTELEEKMKMLVGLQDCDSRIEEILKRMRECPLKIQRLEEGLADFEVQLKAELSSIETLKRERRGIEQELQVVDSKIQKSQIKLSNIKSNKEYQAALKEIDDLRLEKSLLEDKVLDVMEKIEHLEARVLETRAELKKQQEKVKGDRKEIHSEMTALERELARRKEERQQFCNSLDRDILRNYELLRERKAGIAVSPVVNGVCLTCHMGIPPQMFNELIRGDQLHSCPHCMRIIYWGGNEQLKRSEESSAIEA
jgi:predicted  nucleic acid-binding Zn-ribbon protein